MAGITTRKPDTTLDGYYHIVKTLKEIFGEHNAIKRIEEQLRTTELLSCEQQKILEDAQETIARAEEIKEDFEKRKFEELTQIKEERESLQISKSDLFSERSSFETEKQKTKEQLQLREEKIKESLRQLDEEIATFEKAKNRFDREQKEHIAKVVQFEEFMTTTKEQLTTKTIELETREQLCRQKEEQLIADRTALNDRKQRLDRLLKESEI